MFLIFAIVVGIIIWLVCAIRRDDLIQELEDRLYQIENTDNRRGYTHAGLIEEFVPRIAKMPDIMDRIRKTLSELKKNDLFIMIEQELAKMRAEKTKNLSQLTPEQELAIEIAQFPPSL